MVTKMASRLLLWTPHWPGAPVAMFYQKQTELTELFLFHIMSNSISLKILTILKGLVHTVNKETKCPVIFYRRLNNNNNNNIFIPKSVYGENSRRHLQETVIL